MKKNENENHGPKSLGCINSYSKKEVYLSQEVRKKSQINNLTLYPFKGARKRTTNKTKNQ